MKKFFEKRRNKKRDKTFLGKVVKQPILPNWGLLSFEVIVAMFLDLIKLILNFLVILTVVLLICLIILTSFAYMKFGKTIITYYDEAVEIVNLSDDSTFKINGSSFIYDSDGNVLAKLKADQDSIYLEYKEIPEDLIEAFIAVEDRSFWDNPGIDLKGLVRVVVDFVKTQGDEMHGASTITQQLSRNIFLSHEVSLERKAKEMIISVLLTQKYSKEDIMEFYVNDICFANAYYGIEAASIGYFNKSASELTLSQLAYLAAIPNSPTYYDPYKNPERAILRRNKILDDMLELEYISQTEYDAAIKEEIVIERPSSDLNDYLTTYAVECATKYLMKQDGFEFQYTFTSDSALINYKKDYGIAHEIAKEKLYNGGYHIYTTLNKTKQEELQKILDKHLTNNTEVDPETGIYQFQGAMTVIDNSTGKVVAIVGGRSQEYKNNTYTLNRAYQSYRQPGSAIKPLIVYAPSLENGYTDESIVKDINVDKAKENGTNIDSLWGKSMTVRYALEQSKNGVAWYLLTKITPKVGLKYITDMHFSSIVPSDYNSAAALGGLTYGTTTTEMAGAYAALANSGIYRETTCIDKIIDSTGRDVYREPTEKQIYSRKAANTTIDMMKGVITKGTAAGLKWSKSSKVEAAAKTGTTNDNKDGWMCGSTPYYTISVWVGYDMPKEMPTLWGSSYPAQIWKDAMLYVIGDIKSGSFNSINSQ
jgi:membrane peptidoglycan carboxypeptidase